MIIYHGFSMVANMKEEKEEAAETEKEYQKRPPKVYISFRFYGQLTRP